VVFCSHGGDSDNRETGKRNSRGDLNGKMENQGLITETTNRGGNKYNQLGSNGDNKGSSNRNNAGSSNVGQFIYVVGSNN
jgi:hypothetical protein